MNTVKEKGCYPSFKEDAELLTKIQAIIKQRATYGYRRVTAILNQGRTLSDKQRVNHKRVYRIMKESQLLMTAPRRKPTRTHKGTIITLKSNMRWCSDGFGIRCCLARKFPRLCASFQELDSDDAWVLDLMNLSLSFLLPLFS